MFCTRCGDAGVRRREDRRERAVVAEVGEALEQRGDDLGAVEGERDRLAHPRVGERGLVVAHRQLAVRARLQLDHVVAAGQQRLAAGHRELPEDVDAPAGQREDRRGRGVVEGELGLRGQRLGAPVRLVAGERGAHLRRVRAEHERAGADERALPARGVVVVRDDDHVVVVGGGQVREVPVRGLQVEGHREVVDLHHAGRLEHSAERGQRVRGARRVRLQLVGVHHVVGGQRGAVVELDPLADLECPDGGVGVRRPAGGQHRGQGQALAGQAQVLAGLREHVQPALVGHGHRVDRRGRRDDAGLDHRAGRAGSRRRRTRRRARRRRRCCRRRPGSTRAPGRRCRPPWPGGRSHGGTAAPRRTRR